MLQAMYTATQLLQKHECLLGVYDWYKQEYKRNPSQYILFRIGVVQKQVNASEIRLEKKTKMSNERQHVRILQRIKQFL
jgi:hypothetical protein